MEQTSLMTRLGSTMGPVLLTAGLVATQNPKLKTQNSKLKPFHRYRRKNWLAS